MSLSRAPKVLGSLIGFVGLSAVAGLLVGLVFVPSLAVAGEGVVTGVDTFNSLPSYLQIEQPAQASAVYAKQGGKDVKIASFYVQNRTDVASNQIAEVVKQSTIDTEDPRFYKEGAIDVQGTIRGALATGLGHNVQGGSSITQQYVKNVLVQRCAQQGSSQGTTKEALAAADKCYSQVTATTPARKLREMRYAIGIEKRYSKDDILRGYLNIVGFGGTVYGVQAASEYYFGVPARSLSIVQAATLTAIINNPANLRIDRPTNADNGAKNHYALTLTRRNYVLKRMAVAKDITERQYLHYASLPIQPKITPQSNGCSAAVAYDAAYFCSYVQQSVLTDPAFGSTSQARVQKLTEGGLKIYTTLNLDLQRTSQAALSAYMPTTVPGLSLGAANVAVEPGTGRIVTMVQNTTFDETSTAAAGATSVNYNTDHAYGNSQGFQTGSSFKPFTLAAWLEAGHTLNETVSTTQHKLPFSEFTDTCSGLGNDVWDVSNADPAPASMSVMAATAESVNTAFADMGTKLDLCGIADSAFGMGIHPAEGTKATNFHIVPSMILGTNYISPLTMATAYAGIANHGVVCTPIAIDRIIGAGGKAIAPTKTSCTQGMPSDVAAGLAYALQPVLKAGGTGALANPGDGIPTLAKTGTTDAAVQNWLVTSTTKIAQATWVGNVQGSAGFYRTYVNGVYGYNLKFLMDKTILQALDQAYGGDPFPLPPASMIGAVKPKPVKTVPGGAGVPTTGPGTTVGGTGTGPGNGNGNGNGNNKGGAPAKP
ncbi:Penicillin-binding protein 1A [Frondihabitans sp. 762G35]|uniref:transglycosylase domain-containing protein n=1 Tax=Frondihabitans sp. 762G35 TaxID=1446794 RepID=UPI000D20BEEA|nr:transglycosylase domain-containing protein [Frondihabitans sp. 762G35]ARC57897.1 Penicillin-binding protein 1A [Frondihabitans sp. 762G35]